MNPMRPLSTVLVQVIRRILGILLQELLITMIIPELYACLQSTMPVTWLEGRGNRSSDRRPTYSTVARLRITRANFPLI